MVSCSQHIRRAALLFTQAYTGFPSQAWILALAVLLNRMGTMVLPFLALYLTQQKHFSPSIAGNVLMLWGMGGIVGTLSGGWLSDRLGSLRTQTASLLGASVCLMVFYHVSSEWGLYATAFISTVVIDLFRPANVTCMMSVCDASLRPRALTLVRLAVNTGMSIGPALGGYLVGFGYHWVFGVDAATSLLAAMLLWIRLGWKKELAPTTHSPSVAAVAVPSPWKDKVFREYFLLNMVLAVVYFQLLGVWSVYLKNQYHLKESTLGLLWAVSCLIAAVAEMPYMRFFHPSRALYSVASGGLCLALACVCLPLGVSEPMAWVSVGFFACAEVLWMPMLGSMATTHAPAHGRGRYIGMYSSSASWALLIAPWLGTRLYEHVSPNAVWWVTACLALAGALWACTMQIQKNTTQLQTHVSA